MEFIDMRFIMNRLLDSPATKNLKLSSAATYVKDFSSINRIAPIIGHGYSYSKIIGYKAIEPPSVVDIVDMYLCDALVYPVLSGDNRLSATMKESKIPDESKVSYGLYKRDSGVINTDIEEGVLEIYHTCMRVDEYGFPVLPYDGSLMEAVVNYIKYRYFTILWESKLCDRALVDNANSEYVWYIGQYTMKETIPTFDEAVAWANSWQRLITEKDLNMNHKSFPEHLNF